MTRTISKRKHRAVATNGAVANCAPIRVILDQEADAFTIPESAHTLQGFREWSWSDDYPRQGYISFVDGEIIVDISKEGIDTHVLAKGELYSALANFHKNERSEEHT